MASRGSVARNGRIMDDEYSTVDVLRHGEKVIEGFGAHHTMPDYSHSPNAVYVIRREGKFKALRVYDENNTPIIEIAYHPEAKLNNGNRKDPIWHMRVYKKGDLTHSPAQLITAEIEAKYKHYLEDIGYDKK